MSKFAVWRKINMLMKSEMNVLMLLLPKVTVDYLFSDFTVRQSLEKMDAHGYNEIPVIDRQSGVYVRSVAYGDFLRYILKNRMNFDDLERIPLSSITSAHQIQPVPSTTNVADLKDVILSQNFIPVVDDHGIFIGIVTRKSILKHLFKEERIG